MTNAKENPFAKKDQAAGSAIAYTVNAARLAVGGISRGKMYQEINSGRLKSMLHCGRRLILRRDLLAWLRASQKSLQAKPRRQRPARSVIVGPQSPPALRNPASKRSSI